MNLSKIEICQPLTVITNPQLSVIILEDKIVIITVGIVSVEVNYSDCFTIVKMNDEVLANLPVVSYRAWIQRQLNNAWR
ncbi:hypothetical protein FHV99_002861 [Ochrobactrum sp. P20RRXII]|nr:hypothetical protein [Ochrobactrum sp. P20RRXII]